MERSLLENWALHGCFTKEGIEKEKWMDQDRRTFWSSVGDSECEAFSLSSSQLQKYRCA
jgi:hypothetical protein